MLKFGLLIILLNIFLKLVLGIGLWKMAMDSKMNYSAEYHEEPIEGGNPDILRGQNNNVNKGNIPVIITNTEIISNTNNKETKTFVFSEYFIINLHNSLNK